MKPLYILLVLYAVLITGLADGLEFGFMAIPAVGIIFGLTVSFCINVTMGAGLLLLLVQNDMFHPKFGPFGVTLGAIPGLNTLPIWIGLVIAGIIHKVGQEESGLLGVVARTEESASSFSLTNPVAAIGSVSAFSRVFSNQEEQESIKELPKERASLNLKSPNMGQDVTPRRALAAANDNNRQYVQKAA